MHFLPPPTASTRPAGSTATDEAEVGAHRPAAGGAGPRVDPYAQLDLTGTGMSYRTETVTYHGEEFDYVAPGRRVIELPDRTWPATRPEQCTSTEPGLWITPQLLVCRGCGLDCT